MCFRYINLCCCWSIRTRQIYSFVIRKANINLKILRGKFSRLWRKKGVKKRTSLLLNVISKTVFGRVGYTNYEFVSRQLENAFYFICYHTDLIKKDHSLQATMLPNRTGLATKKRIGLVEQRRTMKMRQYRNWKKNSKGPSDIAQYGQSGPVLRVFYRTYV